MIQKIIENWIKLCEVKPHYQESIKNNILLDSDTNQEAEYKLYQYYIHLEELDTRDDIETVYKILDDRYPKDQAIRIDTEDIL